MAYRALEFRQAQREALALVEPAGAEPTSGAVLDAQARADRPASVGLAPAGPAAFRVEPPTAADPPTVGAGQAGGSANSDPTGDTNPTALAPTAMAPAEPAPTGTTAPAITAVGAGASVTVTATTRDPLAEFNPRPSCDDKAQELNVGNQSACSAASL